MARAIWKGSISFGLLNIPVELMGAKEGKENHFSMIDSKSLSPIKFKRVAEKTGKEIPYSQISKAFKLPSGKLVILDEKDFKLANPKATQTIDIEDFVELSEIDTLFFEKPYYLIPQKNGEKSYFLLRDALKKADKVAVGRIVLRTKQHLCSLLVRGDYIILEMMRYAHEVLEVHEADYLKNKGTKKTYSDRELKMAEQLIESMTEKWEPSKYKDTYYNDLMKRIKLKSKKAFVEPEEVEKEEKNSGNVIDLLPLLQKSLDRGGSTAEGTLGNLSGRKVKSRKTTKKSSKVKKTKKPVKTRAHA